MSAGNIDKILELWNKSLSGNGSAPFRNHSDMYSTIDSTPLGKTFVSSPHILYFITQKSVTLGDTVWKEFSLAFKSEPERDPGEPAAWKTEQFPVYYRDPLEIVKSMIANPDFKNEINFGPYREFNDRGKRRFRDFMSGEWAWRQAVSCPFSTCSSFLPNAKHRKPYGRLWGKKLQEHPSFQSSSVATRRRYRWLRVKTNSIRCICLLAMSPTPFAEHIGMRLPLSLS